MCAARLLTMTRRTVLLLVALSIAALAAVALTLPTSQQEGDTDGGGAGSTQRPAVGAPEPVTDAGAMLDAVAPPADGAAGAVAEEADRPAIEFGGSEAAGGGAGIAAEDIAGRALAVPEIDARIVRMGSIALRLRAGRFEEGWSDAQAVAGAFGGYVVSASRSGTGDGPMVGTITMRVAGPRFDAAIERLRDLSGAKVERLDVSSQDVTQEYTDVRSRLRHDGAVEARLLALLARTDGVSEVLAVQARLDQVQEQIEISRGRLQVLEKLTAMSTIEVTLREPGARSEERDEPVLAEAWGDARDRFAENVAGAVVWLGGALPGLLLLAVGAVVARSAWRRRQRSAGAARRAGSAAPE